MKNIIGSHTNIILIGLAILFLAMIVGVFIWGIGYLVAAVGQADNGKPATNQLPGFDLQGAAKIDYRGVIPQPASSSLPSAPTGPILPNTGP